MIPQRHPSLGIVFVGLLITRRRRQIAYELTAISPNVGNIPHDAMRGIVTKRVEEAVASDAARLVAISSALARLWPLLG